jgi:hypothetical protein
MVNDYPSRKELKTIKEFDLIKKSVNELYDYIEPLWKYPDRFVRTKHTLYLSTGGWSGNESIIEALQKNFLFWSMYWFRSRRGGHYWFNDKLSFNDKSVLNIMKEVKK